MQGSTATQFKSGTYTHLNVVAPVLFRHAFLRKKMDTRKCSSGENRKKNTIADENKHNFESQVHH